jgi:hypothetical protein
MPKNRKIITPAPVAPTSNIPAPKRPARALGVPPAVKPLATASAIPAPADAPAKPTRIAGVERTAATIAADRTNFAVFSDRDASYIAYYAPLAKRTTDGVITVRAIAEYFRDTGHAPAVPGSSAKPHDAGVIVRLTKAAFIVHTADGTSFRFHPLVTADKAPDKAPANLLRARALYASAKA